jgi:hypothetical protein
MGGPGRAPVRSGPTARQADIRRRVMRRAVVCERHGAHDRSVDRGGFACMLRASAHQTHAQWTARYCAPCAGPWPIGP